MALVGYGRVSSAGQSLDIQEEALRAAGCDKLFVEKRSGRQAADRPALQDALGYIRDGDTLVVTRLDRLARSVVDLHRIVETIVRKGADLLVLQQSGIDTRSSAGKLTLAILAAVAEFEADIRSERQREGIAAAKEAGRYKGRPRGVEPAEAKAAIDNGERPVDAMRRLGVSKSAFYRALELARAPDASP